MIIIGKPETVESAEREKDGTGDTILGVFWQAEGNLGLDEEGGMRDESDASLDKAKGAVIGALWGDAIGAVLEFCSGKVSFILIYEVLFGLDNCKNGPTCNFYAWWRVS